MSSVTGRFRAVAQLADGSGVAADMLEGKDRNIEAGCQRVYSVGAVPQPLNPSGAHQRRPPILYSPRMPEFSVAPEEKGHPVTVTFYHSTQHAPPTSPYSPISTEEGSGSSSSTSTDPQSFVRVRRAEHDDLPSVSSASSSSCGTRTSRSLIEREQLNEAAGSLHHCPGSLSDQYSGGVPTQGVAEPYCPGPSASTRFECQKHQVDRNEGSYSVNGSPLVQAVDLISSQTRATFRRSRSLSPVASSFAFCRCRPVTGIETGGSKPTLNGDMPFIFPSSASGGKRRTPTQLHCPACTPVSSSKVHPRSAATDTTVVTLSLVNSSEHPGSNSSESIGFPPSLDSYNESAARECSEGPHPQELDLPGQIYVQNEREDVFPQWPCCPHLCPRCHRFQGSDASPFSGVTTGFGFPLASVLPRGSPVTSTQGPLQYQHQQRQQSDRHSQHTQASDTSTSSVGDGSLTSTTVTLKFSAGVCIVRPRRTRSDSSTATGSSEKSLSGPTNMDGYTGPQLEALIIRRHSETFYELPKGHLEKGEGLQEAAARELREETGLLNPLKIHGGPLLCERYTVKCTPTERIDKSVYYFKATLKKVVGITSLSDEAVGGTAPKRAKASMPLQAVTELKQVADASAAATAAETTVVVQRQNASDTPFVGALQTTGGGDENCFVEEGGDELIANEELDLVFGEREVETAELRWATATEAKDIPFKSPLVMRAVMLALEGGDAVKSKAFAEVAEHHLSLGQQGSMKRSSSACSSKTNSMRQEN